MSRRLRAQWSNRRKSARPATWRARGKTTSGRSSTRCSTTSACNSAVFSTSIRVAWRGPTGEGQRPVPASDAAPFWRGGLGAHRGRSPQRKACSRGWMKVRIRLSLQKVRPARPAPSWCAARLRCLGKNQQEIVRSIGPPPDRSPPAGLQHQPRLVGRVFVAVLGMDRLPAPHREGAARHGKSMSSALRGASRSAAIRGSSGRRDGIARPQCRRQFTVDPVEQVEVERRRHPGCIVIGRNSGPRP